MSFPIPIDFQLKDLFSNSLSTKKSGGKPDWNSGARKSSTWNFLDRSKPFNVMGMFIFSFL